MKSFILGFLLLVGVNTLACDNCNVYLSMSPNDYKNSIGIFYRQRQMFGEYNLFGEMTTIMHAGHGNDMAFWGNTVREQYNTVDLRASFYFKTRWKTNIILPFRHNTQTIGDFNRYTINGVGDPIVIQSYQLLNTKKSKDSSDFKNRLTVGIGIKFPLGKTNLEYEAGIPNLDLQPGTGSWDLLFISQYTCQYRFLGLNLNLNAKSNGRDVNHYQYGTTLNLKANLFADLKVKKSVFRFSAGGYAELAAPDASYIGDVEKERFEHLDTGGEAYFVNGGVQWFTNRWVVFAEYQHLVSAQLNGYTQLLTPQIINTGILYNF